MPFCLTYQYVNNYIKEKGDKLISEDYKNNKELLVVMCGKCNKNYEQTFDRIKRGFLHNKRKCNKDVEEVKKIKTDDITKVCYGFLHKKGKMLDKDCFYKSKNKSDGLSSWCKECYSQKYKLRGKNIHKIINKKCPSCKKEYKGRKNQIFCSKNCSYISQKNSEKAKKNGFKGGLKSANSQKRRSKGKIHFANLCIETYGNDFTLTNEPIFGGFDCDIILTKPIKIMENGELKEYKGIGICYDGPFHRKQIFKKQSLKQVQTRDRIRKKNIEKTGYLHYIIEAYGKYNKDFVETEFAIMKKKILEI